MSPAGIDRKTPIANFNVGYLGALGSAGTELSLLLGASGCSAAQIGNIVAVAPTCSDAQIANGDPTCSCCMPEDLLHGLDFGGVQKEKVICDTLAGQLDGGAIDDFVKTAANYNNVTWADLDDAIKEEKRANVYVSAGLVSDTAAYDALTAHAKAILAGKAGTFTNGEKVAKGKVMHGICSTLTTALCTVDITSKLAEDLTAAEMRTIMGNFIASGASVATNVWPTDNADPAVGLWANDLSSGWDLASDAVKDEAVRVLSRYNAVNTPLLENMGDNQATVDTWLNVTVGNFAERMVALSSAAESGGVPVNQFDAGVIRTGYAKFTNTAELTGTEWADLSAAGRLDHTNAVYVNGFNVGLATEGATPLTGFQQYADADNMEALVEAFATTLGTYYCKCADDSSDFKTKGCCLSSGKGDGTDFTGFGCLQGLPGWFDTNYADNDMQASLSRSKAVEVATAKTTQDYCPTDPAKMAEYVEYEGESSFVTNAVMEGLAFSGAAIYEESLQGGNAKYMSPQGLTAKAGDKFISAKGEKPGDSLTLFVNQIKRSLALDYSGDAEMAENFNTAEYRPDPKLLWSKAESGDADAEKKLEGEISGTFPLSWEGTTSTAPIQSGGLPVYLSQVNFLNADANLLDATSNGIELYHCFAYPESVPYPDTEGQAVPSPDPVVSTIDAYGNAKVVDVTKCTLIDAAFLTTNKDDIDVWVQVEPATGFTVAGHQRLMASIAPTIDCNPITYGAHPVFQACALGYSATGDFGSCHSSSAVAVEGIQVGGVAAGGMIEGALEMQGKTHNPGFPCSSANVLTPEFNGGKLVPSWWTDIASEAAPKTRKGFQDLGNFLALCGTISMAGIAVGAIILIIGVGCIVGGGKSKVAASA